MDTPLPTGTDDRPPTAGAIAAYRTKPCRYFAETICKKGKECRFLHVDKEGWNWHHEESARWPTEADSQMTMSGACSKSAGCPPGMPTSRDSDMSSAPWHQKDEQETEPPWKKHRRTREPQPASVEDESGTKAEAEMSAATQNAADQVHAWLHEERQTPSGDAKTILMGESASVLRSSDGHWHMRSPYEVLQVRDKNGELVQEFTWDENKDICWSAMLYGRGHNVQKHLAMALTLGSDLRSKVKPELQQRGVTFANILFVTPDALEEAELKAASWFWSVKIVSLPKVEKQRLAGVSKHLTDEKIHPAHVFLKAEAFKLRTQIAVMSDLDLIIVNGCAMAKWLARFVLSTEERKTLRDCGGVAVMHRADSQVTFQKDYTRRVRPPGDHRKRSVSYCFAVIEPSMDLAERYARTMASTATAPKGRLSDQDLLGEVLQGQYLEINHNIIMFPSWFNHADLNERRSVEILESMMWKDYQSIPPEGLDKFVQQFGAVHFSAVFSPTWEDSWEKKCAAMSKSGGNKFKLGWNHRSGRYEEFNDYLHNFLMPLWNQLRERCGRSMENVLENIGSIGHAKVSTGLGRATVTLLAAKIKPVAKSKPSWGAKEAAASGEDDAWTRTTPASSSERQWTGWTDQGW